MSFGITVRHHFCQTVTLGTEFSFIQFTASTFRKLPSIYAFSYFPFSFEGRMWDLIVSVPDHCLSFYFFCPHQTVMIDSYILT